MAAKEHLFPCATCGSDLRFDANAGQLVCDHCGATQAVANGDRDEAVVEHDYRDALANLTDQAETEERRVLSCENCGAQIEFDPAQHAAECPYCATPVVTGTGAHRQLKPAAVLPFAIAERDARAAMGKWLGKLWFAPNGLQDYARKGRAMQGVYAPFWTYDADTRTRYQGERGDAYYVSRQVQREVNGKTQTVTEQVRKVRWTHRSGRVQRFFNDVLVLASRALPRKYTDALAPWDLQALEAYSPDYLAGYRAEAYTVSLEDGFAIAREEMDSVIRGDVRADIGGDEQRIHVIDTAVSDITFKHILLPVWVAAYKFRGKSYRFVVNGRTGKVKGERPWSWIKISLAVLLGLIVAGIVIFIVNANQ